MCHFKDDCVRTGKHVYDVSYKFFFIFCKSSKPWFHSNICGSFVNVLLFRDVFLVCLVVFWIFFWFFFSWWRLVWGTRLFFTKIFFFVFGGSLLVSIESLFITFRWLISSWFSVVFSFSYWSRILRIEL